MTVEVNFEVEEDEVRWEESKTEQGLRFQMSDDKQWEWWLDNF